MNKTKRIITVVLCLIMAIGNLNLAFGADAALISAKAKDYEGHWAQTTIQKWIDESKISGYPDGSFKPDANITRAEFVKIVNGIVDYDVKGTIAFEDVKSDNWYYNIISIAQEIGYISGYSKNQFGPNDNITREQAAAIIARIQYLGENKEAVKKFTDNNKISAWAASSVGAASEAGFINGYDNGSFNPSNKLTRAEAITMLDNVLAKAKNKVIYKKGTELKDAVIDGNLIIAKTVGEGDVHLTNVEVKGNIFVYGGGLNSLYFNNVKVAKIEVEKDKVRLVFDGGTKVEEIAVGTETKLENKNGEIAKITIDSKGKVTLTGSFETINVVSSADVTLDNAKIQKLVVEKPINILGTGTIVTLTANADGIKYDSTTKVTNTVIGENVTKKPEEVVSGGNTGTGGGGGTVETKNVVSVTAKLEGGTTVTIGPIQTDYTSTSVIADVLTTKIQELLAGNEAKLKPYLPSLEKKLRGISIGGIPLYNNDGVAINGAVWDKVVANSADLSIKAEDVGRLKMSLEGELKVEDLSWMLSLHNSYRKPDGTLDVALLEKAASVVKEKANKITYTGDGTFKIVSSKKGTYEKNAAIEFVANNIAFSAKTVDEFFNEFGDITIESSYNGKTAKITILKSSIPK